MIRRLVKIGLILSLFVFSTGFMPLPSLIGPGLTIASSGNVYKATLQILIDHEIKNKTGKNSLTYVKEEVKKQHKKDNLQKDLKNLIEIRVKIAHEKIIQQNLSKDLNKEFIQLVEKRIRIAKNKIKIN